MSEELTAAEAVRMHRELADYHHRLARSAVLDIVHEYHADLAERFRAEADQIPERTAARERVAARHRQQQADDDGA